MMAGQEQPTPEEVNVSNRALIQDLRFIYTPSDEAQSLNRVRERLRSSQLHQPVSSIEAVEKPAIHMQQKQLQQVHKLPLPPSSTPPAHPIKSYLSMLAALLILALIVGTLLAVTHLRPQHAPIANSLPSTATTQASSFGNGWKVVAAFNGTGSKTITNQHLVFKHVLGVWITCTGKGTTDIVFNTVHGKTYHTSCHGQANNRLNSVLLANASYAVEQMNITVDKNSSWQLQLVSCLNITATSACGVPLSAQTSVPIA
jgi:hypothetical protein